MSSSNMWVKTDCRMIRSILADSTGRATWRTCSVPPGIVDLALNVEIAEIEIGKPGRDVLLAPFDARLDDVDTDVLALGAQHPAQPDRVPADSAPDLEHMMVMDGSDSTARTRGDARS